MPEKFEIGLGNVQKTLLFPLWGRAAETGKREPLLVDRTAVEIIDMKRNLGIRSKMGTFLSDTLKMQYLIHLKTAGL